MKAFDEAIIKIKSVYAWKIVFLRSFDEASGKLYSVLMVFLSFSWKILRAFARYCEFFVFFCKNRMYNKIFVFQINVFL